MPKRATNRCRTSSSSPRVSANKPVDRVQRLPRVRQRGLRAPWRARKIAYMRAAITQLVRQRAGAGALGSAPIEVLGFARIVVAPRHLREPDRGLQRVAMIAAQRALVQLQCLAQPLLGLDVSRLEIERRASVVRL